MSFKEISPAHKMQSRASVLKVDILNFTNSNKKSFNPGISSCFEVTVLKVVTEGRLRILFKKSIHRLA